MACFFCSAYFSIVRRLYSLSQKLSRLLVLLFCFLLYPVTGYTSDIFISNHEINPSVYDHFDGNLLGSLPRKMMRIGNIFDMSFDLRINQAYWDTSESHMRIITLASGRDDFVDGGTETLDISIGQEGLTVMTHYRSFTRIYASEWWEKLPRDTSAWNHIRIISDGRGGPEVYINGEWCFTLIDTSDPGWGSNPGYSAPWRYKNSGVVHNIWAPAPGGEGADVSLANIVITGGHPQFFSMD